MIQNAPVITNDEILVRLVRIESKVSALMAALGFDTHGTPLPNRNTKMLDDDVQPISNASRPPFPEVTYRGGGYKYGSRN